LCRISQLAVVFAIAWLIKGPESAWTAFERLRRSHVRRHSDQIGTILHVWAPMMAFFWWLAVRAHYGMSLDFAGSQVISMVAQMAMTMSVIRKP